MAVKFCSFRSEINLSEKKELIHEFITSAASASFQHHDKQVKCTGFGETIKWILSRVITVAEKNVQLEKLSAVFIW